MTKSKNKKQEKEIMLDVYFLLDPTQPNIFDQNILDETFHFDFMPYYVGIGLVKNYRYNHHFRPSELNKRENKEKDERILSLITLGYNPKLFILKRQFKLEKAILLEKESIKIFGRKDKGTGILFNHSNGGEWKSFPWYNEYMEKLHNQKTIEICNKIINKKKLTQQDRTWIYNQRGKINKRCKGVFPKSSMKISTNMGVPDLFNNRNNEEIQLEYAKQVFDFRDSHNGALPDKRSKDKKESFLGRWIIGQTRVNLSTEPVYGIHRYDSIFKLESKRGYIDTFIKKKRKWKKPVSEETRKKHSIAGMGRIVTKETREKISKSISGPLNYNYGQKAKEETKIKMAESRRVLSDDQVIEIYKKFKFENMQQKDIAKIYDVDPSVITRLVNQNTASYRRVIQKYIGIKDFQ